MYYKLITSGETNRRILHAHKEVKNTIHETFSRIIFRLGWYPLRLDDGYYYRLKPLFKSPHYRHYAKAPADLLCLAFNTMTILNNVKLV